MNRTVRLLSRRERGEYRTTNEANNSLIASSLICVRIEGSAGRSGMLAVRGRSLHSRTSVLLSRKANDQPENCTGQHDLEVVALL